MKTTRPLSILFELLIDKFKKSEWNRFICNTINSMVYSNLISRAEHKVLMDSFLSERPTPTKNVRYYKSKYYAKGSDINEEANGWWISLRISEEQTNACEKQRVLFLKSLLRKHKKLENNLVVSN
jgi:hypothetical protein